MNGTMIAAFVLTLLIMLVGLAGTVLPVIPGLPIMWVGALIYALLTGFENVGWTYLVVFGALTVAVQVLDYVANLYGAKKMGAGGWGILGAFLGMVVGLFTGGLLGLLLGPFVGAFLGEMLIARKTASQALKAGLGTFLGFLGGTLVKFAVGCCMLGVFLWEVLL
jgi:uncharacterized protein YqgC (DUF456 family)